MLHYTDKTYNFQFFQEIWKYSIFRILFLKIEMENHFYNLFISSYYNSYFLKFLNENALYIHQYLLCPNWNKANNKEYTVFLYIFKLHNIYDGY